MAIRRYARTNRLALGTRYGTSDTIVKIRNGMAQGLIPYRTIIVAQGQRLDTVAGRELKDATLWWVIAAMSDIGWAPQVPPGTVLRVPTSINAVAQALAL
jgi:hypothetical protein